MPPQMLHVPTLQLVPNVVPQLAPTATQREAVPSNTQGLQVGGETDVSQPSVTALQVLPAQQASFVAPQCTQPLGFGVVPPTQTVVAGSLQVHENGEVVGQQGVLTFPQPQLPCVHVP